MSNTAFKVGDNVVTNAGRTYSPLMTIKWIDNDSCLCIWYNKLTNQFDEYKFPKEMLTKLS
jgi:uncharacterized protein YodC (DUF2158 family)